MLLSHALSSSRYHLHMVCAMPLLASPSLLHRASVEAYPQVCLGLCPSAPTTLVLWCSARAAPCPNR